MVVLHQASWRDAAGLIVAESSIANHFVVSGERVQAVSRFDALADALAEAGLSEAAEMTAGTGR